MKLQKQVLNAYNTYKLWCGLLSKANKGLTSLSKSVIFKAMNYWRSEFFKLAAIEKQLRKVV